MRNSALIQQGQLEQDWATTWVNTTSAVAVFALTSAGVVGTWNPGGMSIYGYEADDIIGQHSSIFFPDDIEEAGSLETELCEARARGSLRLRAGASERMAVFSGQTSSPRRSLTKVSR